MVGVGQGLSLAGFILLLLSGLSWSLMKWHTNHPDSYGGTNSILGGCFYAVGFVFLLFAGFGFLIVGGIVALIASNYGV